jgi:hypothetical protein
MTEVTIRYLGSVGFFLFLYLSVPDCVFRYICASRTWVAERVHVIVGGKMKNKNKVDGMRIRHEQGEREGRTGIR